MRRLLTEPLVHFLILGGLLFGIFQYTGDTEPADLSTNREIVVTPGRIETLAANFAKVWQRPPSDSEITGLVEEFIREEIFYREALALGMDRDDTIIRRRLRQKLEFITTDLTDQVEVTDTELQAFLDNDPESYRIDPVLSFEQVYLDPKQHQDAVEDMLGNLRVQIANAETPADLEALGDRLMIPTSFEAVTVFEVDRTFGRGFGELLVSLPLDAWSEPLRSGYGVHFVRVSERIEGRQPELDEVRMEVERDWRVQQQKKTADAFYQALHDRYTITIQE